MMRRDQTLILPVCNYWSAHSVMEWSVVGELLANAVVTGILLGGFYAAVALGISIAFGMLDIANISHPAMIVLGSFIAYYFNAQWGIDPLLLMFPAALVFALYGAGLYGLYYRLFESREKDQRRGLAFFFGLLFVTEVGLILMFGVDLRSVDTSYGEVVLSLGFVSIPVRLLVPFLIGIVMIVGLHYFLNKTYFGLAVSAISQDMLGLRLMAIDPIKIKQLTFGLSLASAAFAGAALIIIQPIEPSIGREYIGRVFAVCVLGGMGSLQGTLIAALLLGTAESITSTFVGPSWAPAVGFGLLLLTLAFKPEGLMTRK